MKNFFFSLLFTSATITFISCDSEETKTQNQLSLNGTVTKLSTMILIDFKGFNAFKVGNIILWYDFAQCKLCKTQPYSGLFFYVRFYKKNKNIYI